MWNNHSGVWGSDRPTPSATPKQLSYIEDLCRKLNIEMGRVLDMYGVDNDDDLDIARASEIIGFLKAQSG